jgi:hypothetical protein
MTIAASAADLADGYEAPRAQALGEVPASPPRGRAVLAHGGLPAFMHALALAARQPTPAWTPTERRPTSLGAEIVSLLTDMVLASGCFA